LLLLLAMKLALDPAYLPDVPLTAAETSHLDALANAISAEDAPDALTALRRLQQSHSPGLLTSRGCIGSASGSARVAGTRRA